MKMQSAYVVCYEALRHLLKPTTLVIYAALYLQTGMKIIMSYYLLPIVMKANYISYNEICATITSVKYSH